MDMTELSAPWSYHGKQTIEKKPKKKKLDLMDLTEKENREQ